MPRLQEGQFVTNCNPTKKGQTKLLGPADPAPTAPGHLKQHLGICAGQPPPFHVEPSMFIVCMLHCRLCVVGGLFKHTIVNSSGKLSSESRRTKQLWALRTIPLCLCPSCWRVSTSRYR